jgi:hypothetical protein
MALPAMKPLPEPSAQVLSSPVQANGPHASHTPVATPAPTTPTPQAARGTSTFASMALPAMKPSPSACEPVMSDASAWGPAKSMPAIISVPAAL